MLISHRRAPIFPLWRHALVLPPSQHTSSHPQLLHSACAAKPLASRQTWLEDIRKPWYSLQCLWGRSLPSNGEGYSGRWYTQRRIAETLLPAHLGAAVTPSTEEETCFTVRRYCPAEFGMPWFLGPQPPAAWVAFAWLSTSLRFLVRFHVSQSFMGYS